MKSVILFLIDSYRALFGPVLHTIVPVRSGCRFHPTCSEHCKASIERFGVKKGLELGLRQFIQCHPFTSRG